MVAVILGLGSFFAVSLAVAQVPQGAPQGPRPGASALDPFLPEQLRAVAGEASKAELDPKRGAQNALELLKAEKSKLSANPASSSALDLRIAATALRAKFLSADEFAEPQRLEQALSTFSRLDITEPGLSAWLDRTLAANAAAAKKLGKKNTWTLKAAVLARSSAIDRQAAFAAFASAMERAGVKLENVPAKEAALVLTLGAEDMPREAAGDSAVKVTLGVERIENKKTTWRHAIYRVEAAKDPAVALKSALEWLARIGGRDIFFHWLGENGFPGLLDPTPRIPGAPPVQAPKK